MHDLFTQNLYFILDQKDTIDTCEATEISLKLIWFVLLLRTAYAKSWAEQTLQKSNTETTTEKKFNKTSQSILTQSSLLNWDWLEVNLIFPLKEKSKYWEFSSNTENFRIFAQCFSITRSELGPNETLCEFLKSKLNKQIKQNSDSFFS